VISFLREAIGSRPLGWQKFVVLAIDFSSAVDVTGSPNAASVAISNSFREIGRSRECFVFHNSLFVSEDDALLSDVAEILRTYGLKNVSAGWARAPGGELGDSRIIAWVMMVAARLNAALMVGWTIRNCEDILDKVNPDDLFSVAAKTPPIVAEQPSSGPGSTPSARQEPVSLVAVDFVGYTRGAAASDGRTVGRNLEGQLRAAVRDFGSDNFIFLQRLYATRADQQSELEELGLTLARIGEAHGVNVLSTTMDAKTGNDGPTFVVDSARVESFMGALSATLDAANYPFVAAIVVEDSATPLIENCLASAKVIAYRGGSRVVEAPCEMCRILTGPTSKYESRQFGHIETCSNRPS